VEHVFVRDDAHQTFFVVHHGKHREFVLLHDVGDFFLVGEHVHGNDVGVHDVPDAHLGHGGDEVPDVHHPHQMVLLVHHEEVVGDFDFFRDEGPQRGDGLSNRGLLVQGHVLGGHEAARGVVGILQQGLHVFGFFHLLKELLHQVLGEVAQEVGRVLGVHLVQDVGQAFGAQVVGHFRGLLLVELFQQFGRAFHVHGAQQQHLVARGEAAEDFGLVRGMQLLQ